MYVKGFFNTRCGLWYYQERKGISYSYLFIPGFPMIEYYQQALSF